MSHSLYYTSGTIASSSMQRLSICNLGVGLNSKQRQRQDTNVFSCKLHLLTLELEDKTVEKNPRIIKIHHMTLHSNILYFLYILTIYLLHWSIY